MGASFILRVLKYHSAVPLSNLMVIPLNLEPLVHIYLDFFFPLIFSTQFSPFSLSGISIVQMLEILDQSSNYLFFLCSGSLSCCCIFWDLSSSPSVEGFVSAIMLLILKSLYPFLFSECSFQYNPVYVS